MEIKELWKNYTLDEKRNLLVIAFTNGDENDKEWSTTLGELALLENEIKKGNIDLLFDLYVINGLTEGYTKLVRKIDKDSITLVKLCSETLKSVSLGNINTDIINILSDNELNIDLVNNIKNNSFKYCDEISKACSIYEKGLISKLVENYNRIYDEEQCKSRVLSK